MTESETQNNEKSIEEIEREIEQKEHLEHIQKQDALAQEVRKKIRESHLKAVEALGVLFEEDHEKCGWRSVSILGRLNADLCNDGQDMIALPYEEVRRCVTELGKTHWLKKK